MFNKTFYFLTLNINEFKFDVFFFFGKIQKITDYQIWFLENKNYGKNYLSLVFFIFMIF